MLLLLASCSGVTPLTNKIQVGEEPFVIGVGEGSDGLTDLYAAPAHGGNFVRLTFTRSEERLPRLHPAGTRVAFVRRTAGGDADSRGNWSLVVLDLASNRESVTPVPRAAGEPAGLGWSRSGTSLAIRAQGFLVTGVPPGTLWLRAVPLDSVSWADSTTTELLGESATAAVVLCPPDYCVVAGADTTRLEGITHPIRWGSDSLGYFGAQGWEVRPLRGGRVRRPDWNNSPSNLRELTYHRGRVRSPS